MKEEKQIDLKNRIINKDNLNGWVSLTTQVLNDKSLDELAVISGMMERIGISMEINRIENAEMGLKYDFIAFKVNEEQYKKATTRHAGRKPDFNVKYDKYGKCTVGELKEKLRTMSKTKIAEELGCSRMTLYRIIKNMEEILPEENMSIWHYTS